MKKEDIFLNLKNATKKEIKEVARILESNNENVYPISLENLKKGYLNDYRGIEFNEENEWTRGNNNTLKHEITLQQFKELFNPKVNIINSTKDILSDLEVGKEIEYNGFILKVDRKAKKWYITKSLICNSAEFRKLTKTEFNYWIECEDISIKEITNQDFINQLEENSK